MPSQTARRAAATMQEDQQYERFDVDNDFEGTQTASKVCRAKERPVRGSQRQRQGPCRALTGRRAAFYTPREQAAAALGVQRLSRHSEARSARQDSVSSAQVFHAALPSQHAACRG